MVKGSPSSRTGRNSRGADSVNSASSSDESDHGDGKINGDGSPAKSPKVRRHGRKQYRYSTGKKGEILLTNNTSTKLKKCMTSVTTIKPANSAGETSGTDDIFSYNLPTTNGSKKPSNSTKLTQKSDSGGDGIGFTIENKLLKNVIDSVHSDSEPKIRKTPPSQLSLAESCLLSHKDSGFSSCGSSQGLSPDLPQSILSQTLDLPNSQDTYCSELEMPAMSSQNSDLSDANMFGSCSAADSESMRNTADTQVFSQDSAIGSMIETNCEPGKLVTGQGSNLSEISSMSVASGLHTISSCSEHLESDSVIKLGDIASLASCRRRRRSDADASPPQSPKTTPTKKAKSDNNAYGSCMMCLTGPKNGVFVHSKVLHLCCCYPCAVKIWNKRKQCPVCNGKVKNVMKLFVH